MDKRENKSIRKEQKELLKKNSKLKESLAHQEEVIKNLVKSNKDYSLIFDKMINGFALHEIILDREGKPCDYRFLEVNPAFEKLTGLERDKIIGKTVLEVLPDLQLYWIETCGKVAMTGKSVYFPHYSQPLGKYYDVVAYSPKKKYFATIFSNVTELKRVNEKLVKLYNLQKVIRAVNQLILITDNEQSLYQKICDILMEIEFVKFVWIGLADKDSLEIKPVAHIGIGRDFLSKVKIKYDDSQFSEGPTGTAIKRRQPLVISDIESDSRYVPWREEVLKRYLLSDIALPLIHEEEIIGALLVYSDKKDAFGEEEVEFLKEVANDIAIGIKSIRFEEKLKKSNEQLQLSMENTIFTIAKLSEEKDPYTAGHQRRVSQLATAIAKKMELSEEKIETIKFASLIHDIGKMSVPGEILTKPTKLTEAEFALIKEHPKTCYNIIKDTDLPWNIADIILQHHERLNGSGYPKGLRDEEILLEAKIIAVADVVEAMSSHRPYRPALGIDKALEEISMNKGKLYDPGAVEACIKLFKEDGFKFE